MLVGWMNSLHLMENAFKIWIQIFGCVIGLRGNILKFKSWLKNSYLRGQLIGMI